MNLLVLHAASFQSTLPRRERLTIAENCWRAWSYFNPRSREGSDICCATPLRRTHYFNPRSREGSDGPSPLRRRFGFYFNPRSREGSDGLRASAHYFVDPFQSTLPRRERHSLTHDRTGGSGISIHAPVKGATVLMIRYAYRKRYFNPRSRFVVENQPVEYIKIDGRTYAFQSAQRA